MPFIEKHILTILLKHARRPKLLVIDFIDLTSDRVKDLISTVCHPNTRLLPEKMCKKGTTPYEVRVVC
jgi:hypothetical protein